MQYDYELKECLVGARDMEGAVFVYQYDVMGYLAAKKLVDEE